jgi:hypothetical protein
LKNSYEHIARWSKRHSERWTNHPSTSFLTILIDQGVPVPADSGKLFEPAPPFSAPAPVPHTAGSDTDTLKEILEQLTLLSEGMAVVCSKLDAPAPVETTWDKESVPNKVTKNVLARKFLNFYLSVLKFLRKMSGEKLKTNFSCRMNQSVLRFALAFLCKSDCWFVCW